MREPDIPETPVLPNGRKDSTFVYRYFQEHFWDGTDFTDERLLHTPVFHNKLKKYFEKVVIQNPDSIIRQADILIGKAKPNAEMFKYIVWFITYTYENSEIMGFDKVFVHVVEKYYMTKQVTWLTPMVMDNIVKKAKRLKPLLIGEPALNMIMMDTSGHLISMNTIKANFLILLFWDPTCGHCEIEIPKLKEIYEKEKDSLGIKIFTVCSDSSMVKWKEAIRKKQMNWINVNGPRTLTGDFHEQYDIISTPVIYLLDEKKTIIAKHIGTEQIVIFLKNFLRMRSKK
jgi:thiol-disulfide isomerase/thioredoxin